MDAERIHDVISALSGTWEPAVLVALAAGPQRSADLRRMVSHGVSYRSFHDTTDRLEGKRLIDRVDEDGAVTFHITDAGRVVLELMDRVERWSDQHPHETTLLRLVRCEDGGQAPSP